MVTRQYAEDLANGWQSRIEHTLARPSRETKCLRVVAFEREDFMMCRSLAECVVEVRAWRSRSCDPACSSDRLAR